MRDIYILYPSIDSILRQLDNPRVNCEEDMKTPKSLRPEEEVNMAVNLL